MTATYLPSYSTLCDRCRLLELDDSALGSRGIYEGGVLSLEIEYPDEIRASYHNAWEDSFPQLPVLSESTRKGCKFCEHLRTIFRQEVPQTITRIYCYGTSYQCDPNQRVGLQSLNIHADLYTDEVLVQNVVFCFALDGEKSEASRWLRLQAPPAHDPLGEGNVQLIQEWLTKVENCNSSTYLPTRLVDVRSENGDICRLVETSSAEFIQTTETESQSIRYAAMSYCWGEPDDAARQLQTNRETYKERVSGFPMMSASPILRDVIKVAREVGMPYLWIDALCIIQGDKDDWERESASMADIYKNAFITICTPASDTCQKGFLERQSSSTPIPFQSRVNSSIKGVINLRFIGTFPSSIDSVRGFYADMAFEESNWAQRAWVFQEQMLSQNLLVFGASKLHFLLRGDLYSEGGEDCLVGYLNQISQDTLPPSLQDEWHDLRAWVMRNYSKLKLTKRADKLPAISGLASTFFKSCPDQYLAGLCKETLNRDLFWSSLLHGLSLTKAAVLENLEDPHSYVAPSWSWASRSHGIVFVGRHVGTWGDDVAAEYREEYVKLEAQVGLESINNRFGKVVGGTLTFQGVIAPCPRQLELSDTEGLSEGDSDEKLLRANTEDGRFIAMVRLDWSVGGKQESAEGLSLVLLGTCLYQDEEESDSSSVFEDNHGYRKHRGPDIEMVYDEELDRDYGKENASRYGYGIVIHPARRRGKYVRVGSFETWPHTERGSLSYFRNREPQLVEIV
ncbi:heterokaryon incompatibility protein-domain-containing protein [Annulohypoxylon maeteangense]|uniref:heterokaryon incompatibility protein-domain-containing protein n=1 Tax=Annulohypoxylon maeteangense TaxID=1927788 RepID=UPI002007C2D8|nr:heterokaryon incompatibility protein-domain-containing protein [Annulohypoxylon maeteangense]KAI0890671.1 heterokaryon incompatibility protein-domain-containing protein [Annulohypoxylon maeteangense]